MINFRLGNVANWVGGVSFSPSEKVEPFSDNSIVCFTTKNIQEDLDDSSIIAIPKTKVKRREQFIQQGDILVSTANSWNLVGKCCWTPQLRYRATLGAFISLLRPDTEKVFPRYLYYWMSSSRTQELLRNMGRQTTNISNLDKSRALAIEISTPPLPEQERIAAILDKADRLRRLRRYALELGDSYLQSVFLEMFGDPVTNPMGWEEKPLRSIAIKFSDGPFGSNLKTSHYTPTGVRVIRLQNIGIGQLIDDDKAFISEDHFNTLKKHKCVPGDVIVATLGDPNLRAMILPKSVPVALNKADCVQIRPDPKIVNNDYVCWLINHPNTLHLAKTMLHGQTRTRISMGQLSQLEVPIPPLPFQEKFAQVVHRFEHLRNQQRESLRQAEHLFQSLLKSAFDGGV